MSNINFEELIEKIPEIFVKVKKDVKKVIRRKRAGIQIGLIEIGMNQAGFIGGMHFPPGSDIILNKTPIKVLIEHQPDTIVWAYIYHILLNMYLSALGALDEDKRREITINITEEVFAEENHPAVIFAKEGIDAFFPNLELIDAPSNIRHDGFSIEYIYDDTESYDYYS